MEAQSKMSRVPQGAAPKQQAKAAGKKRPRDQSSSGSGNIIPAAAKMRAQSALTEHCPEAQKIIDGARAQLGKLLGRAASEIDEGLIGGFLTILPPNRHELSSASHSREVPLRLCELQFVKDQLDRSIMALSATARSMVNDIQQMGHQQKLLTEISSSIGNLIQAVGQAE